MSLASANGDTTEVTLESRADNPSFTGVEQSPFNESGSEKWTVFGKRQNQSKVVYLSQIFILYIIIVTALVNISIGSKDFNLWSTLLASCIGLILPSPKFKTGK